MHVRHYLPRLARGQVGRIRQVRGAGSQLSCCRCAGDGNIDGLLPFWLFGNELPAGAFQFMLGPDGVYLRAMAAYNMFPLGVANLRSSRCCIRTHMRSRHVCSMNLRAAQGQKLCGLKKVRSPYHCMGR